MKRILRIKIVAALATVAIGISAITMASSLHAQGATHGAALQSVTARTLAANGITLEQPGGQPAINADQAQQVALKFYPGAQVRERALVRFQDSQLVPAVDRLCWIVSIVPQGGIVSASHRLPGTYFLFVVDAQTGAPVMGTSGGEIP